MLDLIWLCQSHWEGPHSPEQFGEQKQTQSIQGRTNLTF